MSITSLADRKAAEARGASDHRWLVLVVVSIAQLMVVLDATIVNIALPSAQARPRFRRQRSGSGSSPPTPSPSAACCCSADGSATSTAANAPSSSR